MSAKKCGGATLTQEMIEEATKKAVLQERPRHQCLVSPKAYNVLKIIRRTFPNFDPQVEAEIWWKAYNMGLTEEE